MPELFWRQGLHFETYSVRQVTGAMWLLIWPINIVGAYGQRNAVPDALTASCADS